MTRTSGDWREAARENINETIDGGVGTVQSESDSVTTTMESLRDQLLSQELERREATGTIRETERDLVEVAHELLDVAYEIRKLRTGATLRNLEGKEPVGYSKPDGGAAHDAVYGSRALASSFSRAVRWPLQLDEWEHETGERKREPPGRKPVSASGIEKYQTRVGGRTVNLVLGKRDPPI